MSWQALNHLSHQRTVDATRICLETPSRRARDFIHQDFLKTLSPLSGLSELEIENRIDRSIQD